MDDHEHVLDRINGQEEPPLIIEGQARIGPGIQNGSVCVHDGGHLTVDGILNGGVALRPGSTLTVARNGIVNGSFDASPDTETEINGSLNGSIYVATDSVIHVRPTGKLAGTMHVDGTILNQGIRGGPVSGSGDIQEIDGGTVKQPVTRPDGTQTYNM